MERNIVIHWDCLEEMKKMESESIDMILTSPPYDNLRTYNWSLNWNFEIFQNIAKECARVIKKWWVIVWVVWDATIKWSETWTSFRQALYFKDECWLNLHDTMIWQKTNPIPQIKRGRYNNCYEYMFILSKWFINNCNYIMEDCIHYWKINSSWKQYKKWDQIRNKKILEVKKQKIKSNIWKYSISKNNYWHPAIFPEKLAEDHILSWSNEWDTILDPFAWSWTTWKMAKLNNRNYILIEKEADYIDIINKRLWL
jgi:DNA modification methylase